MYVELEQPPEAASKRGRRHFRLGPEVQVDRENLMEEPPKGCHRLGPPRFDGQGERIEGSMVRLKYSHIIPGGGLKKHFDVSIAEVYGMLVPDAAVRDFKACLDSGSKIVAHGWLEAWLAAANANDKFVRNRFAD